MAFEPPPIAATRLSGSRPFRLEHLRARLVADHALEVAHHHRIGVRAGRRADAVEGVGDVGHPVAQASFIASFSVRAPACTGRTSAPSIFMRKTFGFCRSTSTAPM